jgi:hypothetical protein
VGTCNCRQAGIRFASRFSGPSGPGREPTQAQPSAGRPRTRPLAVQLGWPVTGVDPLRGPSLQGHPQVSTASGKGARLQWTLLRSLPCLPGSCDRSRECGAEGDALGIASRWRTEPKIVVIAYQRLLMGVFELLDADHGGRGV